MNALLDEVHKLKDKHKDTNKHVKKLLGNLSKELEDLESSLEKIENGMIVNIYKLTFLG